MWCCPKCGKDLVWKLYDTNSPVAIYVAECCGLKFSKRGNSIQFKRRKVRRGKKTRKHTKNKRSKSN